MTDDVPETGPQYALVTGAERAFGAEVVARLQADGLVIVDDVAALPAGAALTVVVANLTTATVGISFRDLGEDDLRSILDSQLYSLVATVQAAVPHMAAGSAIVQIVSKAYLGSWGGVHIAASAAACVAMGRSMALELATRGIRVNSVATGQPGESWDDARARADIAATVAWLAGADSGHVTGETILVDRGASLRMAQAARR